MTASAIATSQLRMVTMPQVSRSAGLALGNSREFGVSRIGNSGNDKETDKRTKRNKVNGFGERVSRGRSV
jgi:hypothetical protein